MAQQEVRFFRSLKELESAIDQTVSNLPSIHEKGLFSDIDSTENRKLFAQFNFLATQNKKLNSDIHSLEEKIAVETDRGSELIENNKSIGIGKKRQLESLYRQYSDTENSLFDYKKIVRQNREVLKLQFSQEQGVVFTAENHISDLLEKIKGCKQPLINSNFFSDNITLPFTVKNTAEVISYFTKITKANQFFDTILDRIKKQDCKWLSYSYTEKIFRKVNKIKEKFDIVKQILTHSKVKQNNKSFNYALQEPINKIAKASKFSRKEYTGLIKQLNTCMNVDFIVNSLPEKLDLFRKNLELGVSGNNIVPDNLNNDINAYIRILQKSSDNLSLLIDSCALTSDDLDKQMNTLFYSYQTYISFLKSLTDTASMSKDLIQATGEIDTKLSRVTKEINNSENEINKIDSQLSKKLDEHHKKLKINRKDKREKEQQLEDVLKQKKKWEENHTNSFKTTIDSIKQTPGFERLRKDNNAHGEEPCGDIDADGIINVMIPQGNGRQMMLMTLDERKNSQHIHIKVPLDDVINAQVSALSTRFDQVLIADAEGKIYYLSSAHQLSEKKQLGRFQYNTFTYDYIGYQNVKEILKITNNSGNPASVSITPQKQYLDGLSRTSSIPVGDKDFRAFIQPINLPAKYCEPGSKKDIEKQWYLIGVINEGRFQKKALAAPPLIVGSAILLTIIALALLPFLKVVLADRHTMLTKHLRSLVVWSLGVVFSFSILLLCLFVSAYLLNDENQRAVKKLNTDLNHQFNAELSKKLSAFELQQHLFSKSTIATLPKTCLEDLNIEMSRTKTPLPFYTFLVLNNESKHAGLINSIKKQPIKKGASLSNRVYYKNALNGKLWKLNPGENVLPATQLPDTCNIANPTIKTGFNEVYIQRIISYLDGAYETIISGVLNDQRVAVMDVRFDSFFRRILPLHSSFAVVENNTGHVLYHSTPKRALVENFIDETDGSTALITKLYHQKGGALKLTYQGKSIQAYVAPLLRNQNNKQVLWHLVTYKILDLDENRLLVSALTVAAFLLFISFFIFIALEIILSCLSQNFIAKLEKQIGCSQAVKNSVTTNKPFIRNFLFVLFLLIVAVSSGSYCFVLLSLEKASSNYASEYQNKTSTYRLAGYQNIYKKLNWEKLKVDGKKIQKADYLERMVSLYQTKKIESIAPDNSSFTESLGLSLLDTMLPVVSYSTGVFSENLKVDIGKQTALYTTGVIDKKPVYEMWLVTLLLAILIFIIVKLIKAAIGLLVINLFNEVNTKPRLIQDTPLTTSSKNKILLFFTPDQLAKYFQKRVNEQENDQIVTINTNDNLSFSDKIYPEGSVIFITDFASIALQNENKNALLILLETLIAQGFEVILASTIVPSYWLKMQDQYIDQYSLSNTGVSVELYRWSQLLETFDIVTGHNKQDDKPSDSKFTMDNLFKHWALCTFEEQSVLSSLAKNNLVNRHNAEAIDSLLAKNLIEQTPDLNFQKNLRIKDIAFVNFIHQHFHISTANAWHKQGHGQLWSTILPIVLVLILLAVVFLVTTGAEALQYSLSVIAALVAAIPTLSVILGFFKDK